MNKLAQWEQTLPSVWQQKKTALACAAVMMLGSVFGLGGAKLNGYETQVQRLFSGAESSIAVDLDARLDAAANILFVAKKIDGVPQKAIDAAQAQIEKVQKANGAAATSKADSALQQLVLAVYDAAKPLASAQQQDQLAGQLAQFNNSQTIINHSPYHESARVFNEVRAQFPANLIGGVWGVEKMEGYQ